MKLGDERCDTSVYEAPIMEKDRAFTAHHF